MSKMIRYAEAKSVKVDNWGVFFLQKLQNFFNKTDHCDLTLQFNDNSQLKVHRLVLSACTDYFNHLENVCEMYEDVLIMPMDLQADVIVPIVNFMYTGTLEFQYNMYDRLLKTATDMNMTVLLKLLEAHRQTSRIAKQPVLLNKQAPRARPGATTVYQTGQQRAGMAAGRGAGTMAGKPRLPLVTSRQQQPPQHSYGKAANAKAGGGPSRYTEESDGFDSSFDGMMSVEHVKKEEETSPFEKLRKGYTNANVVKRAGSASGSLTSPPVKKPNLEEVKEFTEAARMRSQLTTDDDDSPDYVDDDTHFNDDDDEDYQPPASVKAALAKQANTSGGGGGQTKQIVIKQESKSPGAGGSNVLKQITVKDDSGNVDHAKIISEVLKKYPHLVKKNKNIKLKIMQKPSANASTASSTSAAAAAATTGGQKMEVRTATPLKQDLSMVRRATANIRNEPATKPGTSAGTATPGAKPATASGSGPKTIDAKTMHALIAKGAENMTGPWLCLRCGINGRPISIPSYRAFRNHLVTKHKERIDVRICEHCGWRGQQRNPHLLYHLFTEHNIRQTVKFPKCEECDHVAMTAEDLQKHEEVEHSRADLQQCIYCNKVFSKEMELYDHMKEQHRERAIVDGVLEFTDDEDYQQDEDEPPASAAKGSGGDGKIKILSNITLPPAKTGTGAARTLEPSSEAEAMSNVASGIATSLTLVGDNGVVLDDANFQNQFAIEAEMASVHGENATTADGTTDGEGGEGMPKLVTADGTELQLTQSQKDEIISQLQGSGSGNDVVMVLNEDNFSVGSTIQLGEGVQIVDTASQNIMLMYGQPGEAGSEHNDSQKSDAKADVTASEDDNSQVSAALSEDKDASVDEKQTSLGEADESQESRRTDVSDKQQQQHEDEYDGNTTADDVDMSGHETSETNETLQQAVREEMDMDTEEHDESAKSGESGSAKASASKHDDDSEERQQSDKLRLISELEGDWSEDAAKEPPTSDASKKAPLEKKTVAPVKTGSKQQEPPAAAKKPTAAGASKPEKIAPKKATAPVERKKSGEEKPIADKDEEELDEEEADWMQEARQEKSATDSDADLEKSLEKVTSAKKDSGDGNKRAKESKMDTDEQDADGDDDTTTASAAAKLENVNEELVSSKSKKNGTKAASTEPSVRIKTDASSEPEDDEEDDDEDAGLDEDGKEKSSSKSKEVSSLLGEWDEDDDL